jgi:hypothetical protein
MDHNETEANTIVSRRRANYHPPISDREWQTEKETAKQIGVSHSALRSWRYEDKLRETEGLPWIGRAPRFYKVGTHIRYLKVEVAKWIERNSGPNASQRD